jgi:hypothetical protein
MIGCATAKFVPFVEYLY